jgi:hypothetical protein
MDYLTQLPSKLQPVPICSKKPAFRLIQPFRCEYRKSMGNEVPFTNSSLDDVKHDLDTANQHWIELFCSAQEEKGL